MKKIIFVLCVHLIVVSIHCGNPPSFKPVAGFSAETNITLEKFFSEMKKVSGRKVAVFDGDGTVFGQAPHYLADECLYRAAKDYPAKSPDVIAKMIKLSNVSLPYVQLRVHFFKGDDAEYLRELGDNCYKKYYSGKIYRPMQDLISLLKQNSFEVWIVTASPELMYQKFLSRELGIPVTNVIGVKSVIRGGKITGEMVQPVPQDHGKKEAIETFIQETPLFSAGNSRGDKEMIEYSRGIRMIINPDEFRSPDQTESIASYARKNKWLIEKITDTPAAGSEWVSADKYQIKRNKSNL